MSTLTPFIYADQPVRVVTIDGEPWFVLADLARVLDIVDVSRLNSRLDDGVRQTHPIVDSLGRTQQATIVSEAGMYEVVIRSDKPEAAAFRRWITSEVLPTIRRTGSYGVRELSRRELALMVIEAEDARALAEHRAQQLEGPAAAWQRLASATGDYSVAQAAKILSRDPGIDIGEGRLFTKLAELRWIYRDKTHGVRGAWASYQTAIDCRRLVHRARSHEHPHTGALVIDPPQVRVTVKGIADLHKHLGGIAPLVLADEVAA